MVNYISFPGLGIGEFPVNRVAFSVFGVDIYWYGIITIIAVMIVATYAYLRGRKEGLLMDDLIDYAIVTLPCAVVGARIYEILTNLDDYQTFSQMINIRNGGLSIYGVLIGCICSVFFVSRFKKVRLFRFLDVVVIGTLLAQSFGRWENFVNAECYGSQTEMFVRMGIRSAESATTMYVHPTFLYESLWNLCGFFLLHFLFSKIKKFDGQTFLTYFCWYGLGRGFIEILRQNTSDIVLFGQTVKANSLFSFIVLAVAATILAVLLIRKNTPKTTLGTPIYYPGAKHYEAAKKQMEKYSGSKHQTEAKIGE